MEIVKVEKEWELHKGNKVKVVFFDYYIKEVGMMMNYEGSS